MIHCAPQRACLAAAVAVALALPLTGAHRAAAQAAPQTNTSCPPTATQPFSSDQLKAQMHQEQMTFAQDLAQALNLSPTAVQQAISGLNTGDQTSQTLPAPPANPIAGAAQQLGVTADQLAAAVQAADATLPCNFATRRPNGGGEDVAFFVGVGGNAGGPAIDTSAFFAVVAQNLGGSFTGQQVEAAFQANAPAPPNASQLQSQIQSRLGDLATALGVSTSALTTALQSLGTSGACLPPGVLGGQVTVRTGAMAAPPSYGTDPIFIPLSNPNGPAGPLSLLDQLGIKPCGPVMIHDRSGG